MRSRLGILLSSLSFCACVGLASGTDVKPAPLDDGGADADRGTVDSALFFRLSETFYEYAAIADDPVLHPPTALTLEAWIQNNEENEDRTQGILEKPLGSRTADSFALWLDGLLLCAGVNVTGPGDALCTPWGVAKGVWGHVAFTHDADGTDRVYVDAQLRGSRTNPATPSYDHHPVYFGGDFDFEVPCCSFVGIIDEVRIYGEARDAQQIAADRAGAPPGGNAIVHFPLNEGHGSTARDVVHGLTARLSPSPPVWTLGVTATPNDR